MKNMNENKIDNKKKWKRKNDNENVWIIWNKNIHDTYIYLNIFTPAFFCFSWYLYQLIAYIHVIYLYVQTDYIDRRQIFDQLMLFAFKQTNDGQMDVIHNRNIMYLMHSLK